MFSHLVSLIRVHRHTRVPALAVTFDLVDQVAPPLGRSREPRLRCSAPPSRLQPRKLTDLSDLAESKCMVIVTAKVNDDY